MVWFVLNAMHLNTIYLSKSVFRWTRSGLLWLTCKQAL
jgi:hypothetical protein